MKKFLIAFTPIILFSFLYIMANRQTPKNMEIKTYEEGETLICNNCEITACHKEIIDGKYFSILPIQYIIKNDNQESYDCSRIFYSMIVHNGYAESIIQNINDFTEGIPEDQKPEAYDIEYEPADFILNPNESKEFVLYYAIDREDFKKFPTCIKLANSLYKETYNNKLANGTFYYEIIDLEKGKWNILLLDQKTS